MPDYGNQIRVQNPKIFAGLRHNISEFFIPHVNARQKSCTIKPFPVSCKRMLHRDDWGTVISSPSVPNRPVSHVHEV